MTHIFDSVPVKDAARLSGLSVSMIDYLQRSKLFMPRGRTGARGRGNSRRYVFRDLIVLKAIKRLLDSGASVMNLRKALEEFQKKRWSADPVTLEGPEGAIRYMIASRDGIYLSKDAEYFADLSRSGQLAFSFIIDLENLRGELREALNLPPLQQEFELIGGDAAAGGMD